MESEKLFTENMLAIKRVVYGKKSTPIADREYKAYGLGIDTPVGTVSEWKKLAKEKGYAKLRIIESDGGERTEKV